MYIYIVYQYSHNIMTATCVELNTGPEPDSNLGSTTPWCCELGTNVFACSPKSYEVHLYIFDSP